MSWISAGRARKRRIYHTVHVALWALLASWVVIMVSNLPSVSKARATAERQRAQEISEENRIYCEKWGMKAGTHEHILCTLDLQELRAKVQQRIADDMAF
jgi:hypothetical protein